MPLIRCESCGKSSFAFARRAYVAHCSGCGKPLTGYEDTSAIESEIRERLYGAGRQPASLLAIEAGSRTSRPRPPKSTSKARGLRRLPAQALRPRSAP